MVVSDAQRVAAMGEALTGAPDALECYQLNPAAEAELESALAQLPPSARADRPDGAVTRTGGTMRDHTLERRIADALAADPRVDDDAIAVQCGPERLRGVARRLREPGDGRRALRTASAVTGVDGVKIQLRPRRPGVGPRQDARTEAAVLRAFIADDALPAEAMHVSASDGTVTLRGRVDFASQRDEAEAVARRVPGVSQLRNELDVWTAISPNQVLEQVTGAMGGDRADRLTVTARDNVVTLSGTVRSAARPRRGRRRGGGCALRRPRRGRDPCRGVTRRPSRAGSARAAAGCEQPQLAGARDRLAAAVGVELGVDVAKVGPDRVGGDEQLGGDLGRLEVAGQVAHDAQLGLAELLAQGRRRVAALAGDSVQHIEDPGQQRAVRGAVPG